MIVSSSVILVGLIIFFFSEKSKTPDPEIIKTLSQQNDTLSGWVQNISVKENLLVLRRKKLKPFMPKRDFIRLTKDTVSIYNNKIIQLEEFQKGWPIKVHFKGNSIQNGEYIADKIEVELN